MENSREKASTPLVLLVDKYQTKNRDRGRLSAGDLAAVLLATAAVAMTGRPPGALAQSAVETETAATAVGDPRVPLRAARTLSVGRGLSTTRLLGGGSTPRRLALRRRGGFR